MSLGRGPRVGVGLLLIVLGLIGMFSPGGQRPSDAVEAVTYYGFGTLLIGLGFWFILRRAKPRR